MSISFIVNMEYAFQDKDNIYLVIDLMLGGDLRFHLCHKKKFTEEETSKFKYINKIEFIVACIVLGLEHIHNNGVIHRDIKPENLVFDSDGDFLNNLRLFAYNRFWDFKTT